MEKSSETSQLIKRIQSLAAEIEGHRSAMGELALDRAEAVRQLLAQVPADEAALLLGIGRQAVYAIARRSESGKTKGGTPPLKGLVEAGVLHVGEKLFLRRQGKPLVKATVQEDGSLMVEGTRYASPSGAARAALGSGPVDGWLRWRTESGRNLDQLREEVAD